MKHSRHGTIILFPLFILVAVSACGANGRDIIKKRGILFFLTDPNRSAYLNSQEFSASPHDRAVSRTSGVAPLAVHFFADFVGSASGDERIDRFHHYDYSWDFGDAGSGAWGTSGRSKNTAKGPVAVHVYEEPGDYAINLTVRDHGGIVATENYAISVADPDVVYAGTATICVNNDGDGLFPGAPVGARTIATDDLSAVTQYATAGSRVLFKRGSSWTTSGLTWPDSAGPVTIGAYGPCSDADELGICVNAPLITVTGGTFLDLSSKQDWRIMDIRLSDPTRTNGSFGGASDMQKHLFYRLKIEGFGVGLGWSHWNEADLMRIDDMVIASCDISDSDTNVMYVGSERMALLGNRICDARQSHVVRVWQAYRSVIGHNIISGSSVDTDTGRHALKFHGPGVRPGNPAGSGLGIPVPATGFVDVKTQFSIIADNTFGSSGPWPVALGPQDAYADERISHIIFERNRFHSDYGSQSVTPVQVSLMVWARHCTIRNNIIDGTGSSRYFTGIVIERRGIEPAPMNVEVYHNTICRGDSGYDPPVAITLYEQVRDSIVRNNLASFPSASGTAALIQNLSAGLAASNNLLTDAALFVLPGAAAPLDRDFSLQAGSPALGQGTTVPVFEDYYMNLRPASAADLGAVEQ